MNRARIIASSLLLSMTGCAIHPLPEDFAHLTTPQIVRQIRCETREAVIDSALDWLTRSQNHDEAAKAIAFSYRDNPKKIQKFGPNLFKGQVHQILTLFWTTAVVYNYTLDMTETNNLDANINPLKPFTHGSLGIALQANFDRTRENDRTFTVADTFGDLVQKTPTDYCERQIVGENYSYPITGKIGIAPVVHDFVNLTLFENLGQDKESPEGPPTLVDTLKFTTTVSGSLAPKVTFSPAGSTDLALSASTLTGEASRVDNHQVIIGLAIAKAAEGDVQPLRNQFFGNLLTASGSEPAKQAAARAVDQVLTRKLFSPTIVLPNQ